MALYSVSIKLALLAFLSVSPQPVSLRGSSSQVPRWLIYTTASVPLATPSLGAVDWLVVSHSSPVIVLKWSRFSEPWDTSRGTKSETEGEQSNESEKRQKLQK